MGRRVAPLADPVNPVFHVGSCVAMQLEPIDVLDELPAWIGTLVDGRVHQHLAAHQDCRSVCVDARTISRFIVKGADRLREVGDIIAHPVLRHLLGDDVRVQRVNHQDRWSSASSAHADKPVLGPM